MAAPSIFQGSRKKILIVNTASKYWLYAPVRRPAKLYEAYKDKLVIVGFPANNFGGQEPGSNGEIKEFCKKNYGVTFPMAAKVSVKGDDIVPIYKWLCSKAENGVMDAGSSGTSANSCSTKRGNLIACISPTRLKPMDAEITSKL